MTREVSDPPTEASRTEEAPPEPGAAAAADDRAGIPGAPPPEAPRTAIVVPRWIQLVALPLALVFLFAVGRAVGSVLIIFTIASVIALILNPVVARVMRLGHVRRGMAVGLVYLAFFLALAGIGVLLANPVANQVSAFQRNVPDLVDSANRSLGDLQVWLDDHGFDVQIRRQGQTALQTLEGKVLQSSGDIVSFGRTLLQSAVEVGFALILILVISIYMLLYAPAIDRLVRAVMPPGDGTPEDDYPGLVQRAVYSYVRAQLLFSLIMGASAGVALWILGTVGIFPEGRTYALFFAAWYGLMELIPYVGPVLGALPPVLVALFGQPIDALWVGLTFVALQQFEGHVVAPQVFGHTLRINPLIVIFALLVGAEIYGIVGALLALPLAAIARETVVYLRRHLVLEPWGTASPLALAGRRRETAALSRCSTCGAPLEPAADACPECGEPVPPRPAAG